MSKLTTSSSEALLANYWFSKSIQNAKAKPLYFQRVLAKHCPSPILFAWFQALDINASQFVHDTSRNQLSHEGLLFGLCVYSTG